MIEFAQVVNATVSVVRAATPYLFLFSQAINLVQVGVAATNFTNTVVLPVDMAFRVIRCCALPPIPSRIVAQCFTVGATLACSATLPTPVAIGSALYFIGDIIKRC
jgi:hypothetical protein